MVDREREPLLPSTTAARKKPAALATPTPTRRRAKSGSNRNPIDLVPTLDDYALGLDAQVLKRGYHSGLAAKEEEELEEGEAAIRKAVETFLQRFQTLLDDKLPRVAGTTAGGASASSTDAAAAGAGSEQPESVDDAGAIFGAVLLYLISLHSEGGKSTGHEVEGISKELNSLKEREDVRRRVVEFACGILDSSLEERNSDTKNKIPSLFVGLKRTSGSHTSCLELLLLLARTPTAERASETLLSHPVILVETERVWQTGIPLERNGGTAVRARVRPAFLQGTLAQAFSSVTPKLLHRQHYIFATIHAILTIFILLFSAYGGHKTFNPFSSKHSWNFSTTFVWYVFVLSSLGWFGQSLHADWKHLRSGNSCGRSALLSPFQHTLVFASIFLRFLLLFPLKNYVSRSALGSLALYFLAGSIPFLAAARLLPQDLPNFGSPTQFDWDFINPRKRLSSRYKSGPRTIPESHTAVDVLDRRFGGFTNSLPYIFGFFKLLFWGVDDEFKLRLTSGVVASFESETTPFEARVSIAATIFTIIFISLFSGSTNTPSPTPPTNSSPLQELDHWTTHFGPSIAFKARRERLTLIHHFTYIYYPSPTTLRNRPSPSPYTKRPPLPPLLNLFVPVLEFAAFCFRLGDRREMGNGVRERGRKWVWMVGVTPLMVVWAGRDLVVWTWRWGAGEGRD